MLSPDAVTRAYFDSLLLETRYLDSDIPSTDVELFGLKFSTPVMTAALSHLGYHGRRSADFIDHPAVDGMIVYAAAAARSNTLHWVGMCKDDELEEILSTGAKTVKIVKPLADNGEVFRKIEHAVGAGCIGVGMDIDHAFNQKGGYDNVFGLEMKPKSTSEIAEFVKAAGVPFVAKGVLSVSDAVKCAKAGCAGIVISHHHGMMPCSVAPLMVIEDIVAAVGKDMDVFVDCGIESGMDAYKCLALGAKAVSVGRHLMPFIKNGTEAVSGRINEMTTELANVMARTGVKDPGSMDPSVIHKRPF
ncbi:MAG: alpha-hydroxy acid oxidase [Bacteroidia bacterium]|nr:alpha-hydroxy acid oxidase [Bacteroidia bacterium]